MAATKDNDKLRTGMFATDGTGSIFEGFKKINIQLAAGTSTSKAPKLQSLHHPDPESPATRSEPK